MDMKSFYFPGATVTDWRVSSGGLPRPQLSEMSVHLHDEVTGERESPAVSHGKQVNNNAQNRVSRSRKRHLKDALYFYLERGKQMPCWMLTNAPSGSVQEKRKINTRLLQTWNK